MNHPNLPPKVILARYTGQVDPTEKGNPLTLALPPIKDDNGWLRQMLRVPAFDESLVSEPAYQRAYYVSGLKDAFIPCERHIDYARRLDILLRAGYRRRNPMTGAYAEELQRRFEQVQRSGKAEKLVFSEPQPISSYSLLGVSGMGKSTTTENILSAYPQGVFHEELNLLQVVWLKVECPKDGSVKELARNILRAFDQVLQTSHLSRVSDKSSLDAISALVYQLAVSHCLGLLVIDELQNVSIKKSGGREAMLNWFQELVNEVRLPVLLLGTFKAKDILEHDVRHSRRSTQAGSAAWSPMDLDAEFQTLVKSVWKFQWLKEPTPLTEELLQTVYEETQGIYAFVVDMFLVAQLRAIRQKDEAITPELFKRVARTEFRPVQPFLNALRSKDPNRLRRFEDAMDYDVGQFIQQELALISQGLGPMETQSQALSVLAQASANVRSVTGVDESEARALVERVIGGDCQTVRAATRAALEAYANSLRDAAKPGTAS
ncbi:MAG: ATP-binding protein [Hylemonella sp.]